MLGELSRDCEYMHTCGAAPPEPSQQGCERHSMSNRNCKAVDTPVPDHAVDPGNRPCRQQRARHATKTSFPPSAHRSNRNLRKRSRDRATVARVGVVERVLVSAPNDPARPRPRTGSCVDSNALPPSPSEPYQTVYMRVLFVSHSLLQIDQPPPKHRCAGEANRNSGRQPARTHSFALGPRC